MTIFFLVYNYDKFESLTRQLAFGEVVLFHSQFLIVSSTLKQNTIEWLVI